MFEAPGRLAACLADIADVLGGDRPVAVARELTKRFEETRRGTAAEVAAWAASEPPRGEVVILLGPPVRHAATDAEIEAAIVPLIAELGVKDAAKAVAARLGVPRSRAYAIGLALKDRPR
jgi:16S rRNA (cytidine1402-2'-O)-methyltransferase